MLIKCAINGVDDTADTKQIKRLLGQHPLADFGVAYQPDLAGTRRYGSAEYIQNLAKELETPDGKPHPRLTLHVCDGAIADLIADRDTVTELAANYARLQINFDYKNVPGTQTTNQVLALFRRYPDKTIIVTENEACPDMGLRLVNRLGAGDRSRLQIIFDESCGRGITPRQWKAAYPNIVCLYAGGLGPETLPVEGPRIRAAAGKMDYGIDMDSKLNAGLPTFPIDRTEQVLKQADQLNRGYRLPYVLPPKVVGVAEVSL